MFYKNHFGNFPSLVILCLFLFAFTNPVLAQKPQALSSIAIDLSEEEKKQVTYVANVKVNQRTGIPVSLFRINKQMESGDPITMAKQYLSENASTFALKYNDLRDLKHHATRETNSGKVVRFRQMIDGLPVNKNELTIAIDPTNKVQYVQNSYEPILSLKDTKAVLKLEEASALAKEHVKPNTILSPETNQLMIYQNEKEIRLAYEVVIHCSTPLGEWHTFVDAKTGEIFKVEDQLRYYCKHSDEECDDDHKGCSHGPNDPEEKVNTPRPLPVFATGNGFVFDPDPLSSNTVNYGGNYSDNNDATNADLDASRFNVTLQDITQTGSTFKLEGPWAEIVEHEAPATGLFEQNSSVFEFTREEQGFEAVNIYYHVDFLMRYINITLGCNIQPYQYSGGVQFDPHGANGADQSYYTDGAGRIVFGEGCVDDGEDSDVIHHELGHGLHDWVTSGNLSQVDGLSEGCGDYIAQSYNRGIGNWTSTDPQFNWVFNWDGHNECWAGRVTNDPDSYPGDLGSGIHNDGQMWASTMMQIWDDIGQQATDKIFYEGLGMTNGSSSQDDAANAVYQAAINLGYTPSQLTAIHTRFTNRGYTLPPLDGPPVADFSADITSLCLDNGNTVSFTDESVSSPPATSWAWTFAGGTPATSTQQNPTVTYAADGVYDVTLTVTNINGNDTKTETGYITVQSGAACPSCELNTNNTQVTISTGAAATYTSTITVTATGNINDVIIPNITGTHTWLSDLFFSLEHPDGTTINLIGGLCTNTDNFNIGFDDASLNTNPPCPYTDGLLYVPTNPLSAFDGKPANGTWTLVVVDAANQDGGSLDSWQLEVCTDPSGDPDCLISHVLPGNIISDTYKASDFILSDGQVAANANVFFKAGNYIQLDPGFEVLVDGSSNGVVFSAEIENCIPSNADGEAEAQDE